ncbi:hypothetical protein BJV82DRAFT_593167 [Fennellomyces sp. T-0311]|nr:hypothetical protein BJV82DRAFT_593167 [Fennellomyces sp. T-0311]
MKFAREKDLTHYRSNNSLTLFALTSYTVFDQIYLKMDNCIWPSFVACTSVVNAHAEFACLVPRHLIC